MTKDYYELLGVDRGADPAAMKKAFRRMAQKYHPDRNPDDPNAPERFKEINEAYETLSDERKRSVYDQYGQAGLDTDFSYAGSTGSEFNNAFNDIFENIFGMGGGGRGSPAANKKRGDDKGYGLEISLEQAVFGDSVSVKIPTVVVCAGCHGSGSAAGTTASDCRQCQGHGYIQTSKGFFQVQQTCPVCRGRGKMITTPCLRCGGRGQIEEWKDLSVSVPPGVDTGTRLRLSGKGDAGVGGAAPGDLFIQITVRRHPIFARDGDDLYCEIPIGFTEAALGGSIEVPTLQGQVKMKVPPGTQSGKSLRIRGRGAPSLRRGNKPGDLLCQVHVETPIRLTAHQRKILEAFRETLDKGGASQSPKRNSWFKSMKTFFKHSKDRG